MPCDVAYQLNAEAEARFGGAGGKAACRQRLARVATLCAAVEESTIRNRASRLMPQDEFVRDHLTSRQQKRQS